MNRPIEHVLQYILIELGTAANLNEEKELIIKGFFRKEQIDSVLIHYYKEYVMCKNCKQGDTTMIKKDRIMFMICNKCESSKSVAPLKKGYKKNT